MITEVDGLHLGLMLFVFVQFSECEWQYMRFIICLQSSSLKVSIHFLHCHLYLFNEFEIQLSLAYGTQ